MNGATVSIRELRLNFRAVRKKIQEHGTVTITDNGTPAYELTPTRKKRSQRPPMPDHYARLLKYQPNPLTAEQSAALDEANRGDR